jgi:hypothetical protein
MTDGTINGEQNHRYEKPDYEENGRGSRCFDYRISNSVHNAPKAKRRSGNATVKPFSVNSNLDAQSNQLHITDVIKQPHSH